MLKAFGVSYCRHRDAEELTDEQAIVTRPGATLRKAFTTCLHRGLAPVRVHRREHCSERCSCMDPLNA